MPVSRIPWSAVATETIEPVTIQRELSRIRHQTTIRTMPRAILVLLTMIATWGHAAAAVAPERIHYTGKIGHIVQLQDERLLTLYTLGRAGEDGSLNGPEQPAYIRYSGDQGRSWSKEKVAFSFAAGRGTMPTYRQSAGPYLLRDRNGILHLLSIRYYRGPKRGDPAVVAVSELFHNLSRDGGQTWNKPKRIDVGHHWFPQIQSMIQLSNGRLLTAGNYASDNYLSDTGEYEYRIIVIFSVDQGETWQLGPDDIRIPIGPYRGQPGAIEPILAELRDGRVWMIFRSQYGVFYQTFSSDGGSNWEPISPTTIKAANAPAGILRLADGRLMLSWNDWGNYPGGRVLRRGRQYLHVAISSDDGKTWSPSRLIAGPSTPDPENAQMRYPFLCRTSDGFVLLRYHRIERTIGMSRRDLLRIDPDWISE